MVSTRSRVPSRRPVSQLALKPQVTLKKIKKDGKLVKGGEKKPEFELKPVITPRLREKPDWARLRKLLTLVSPAGKITFYLNSGMANLRCLFSRKIRRRDPHSLLSKNLAFSTVTRVVTLMAHSRVHAVMLATG